jgi:hypothetical protein
VKFKILNTKSFPWAKTLVGMKKIIVISLKSGTGVKAKTSLKLKTNLSIISGFTPKNKSETT